MKIRRFIIALFVFVSCIGGIVRAAGIPGMSVYAFPFLNQLPSNDMSCIFQDSEGLVWVGTADGLCRYDGYNIHVFRSGPVNGSVLSSNNVRSIAETKDGKLLVGTLKGISVFDKSVNRFSTLNLGPDLTNYEVRSIVVDRQGYCWIGSYKKLMRLSPDLKSIKTYDKALPETSVNTVYMDSKGTVWVAFWNNGLFRYDGRRDTFVRMPSIGHDNNPFRLFEDREGRYWVSTWGEGLFTMYPKRGRDYFQPVRLQGAGGGTNHLKNVFGFAQDNGNGYLWMVDLEGMTVASVGADRSLTPVNVSEQTAGMEQCFNSILLDHSGNIWIASASVGGYMINFSESSSAMLPLPSIASFTGGLSLGITALYEDEDHTFWLSQDRWGLGWYDPRSRSLHFYREMPGLAMDPSLADIVCIVPSPVRKGEVWVTPRFDHYIYVFTRTGLKTKIDLERVKAGNPIALYQDSRHFMWVAAQGGIVAIAPSGNMRKLNVDIRDMSSLTGDSRGNIWIGTSSNGLYKLETDFRNGRYSVTSVGHFNTDKNILPSNDIETISFDRRRNRLWIGTMEGHVLSLNMADNRITDYSSYFAGAVNASIGDITLDKFGHVWVSTAKNVVEYNPDDNSTRSYLVQEEEGMTSFIKGGVFYNGGDRIYYGGRGGIACFNVRASSLAVSASSNVMVTDLRVKGVSVLDGTLPKDYRIDTKARKIILGADAGDISIYFSTLNYTHPERVLYAYRIKGFNSDWIYPKGDFPRAYFNELSKGTYTLEIRSADENGKWSDRVETYTIVRLPAWYETWWAYTLYIIAVIAAAYYAYRVMKHRLELKNELRIAKIENEKNEELTQAKLRYFTNVSHDFLTPVSIISCLIDDIGMTYKTHIPQLDRMRVSLHRLKQLIQQVIDFRKLENGKMKLEVSQGNMEVFLRKVSRDNFEPLMDMKHIRLQLDLEADRERSWFDEDKVEKIIYNLLSNAYKYTGEDGTVTVSLAFSRENGRRLATVAVTDTGKGISPEDCRRIFDRFYTANTDKNVESNGIGLALVKELVNLHHGTVRVESEPGQGTSFIITLPVDKESYSAGELASQKAMESALELELPAELEAEPLPDNAGTLEEAAVTEPAADSCMLIVDDNRDLLEVMSRIFSRHYKVLLAHDGKEGLSVVETNPVDIIISDVMMPEMDGLTFCRRLKSDLNTSHIPVILLTAKNSPEDRVACYEAGADGYIAKPFELNVLEARIENFLRRKKKRQTAFKSDPEKKTDTLKMSPLDQKFLDKVVHILETNMAKSNDIDMELITREVAMSKSSFYRKMKAITGLSPIEFIKNFRLKHAYELLEKGADSIADVAYSSGFSNTKYFATCFKDEFGMTPSKFIRRNQ